jgi:hypothetical protein
MFRTVKCAIAALLGLAIAVLPVVLDRCADSCEAHQHIAASTPACHHAASTGTHVSQVPSPCGHDHNATTLTAAKRPASTERAFGSIVATANEQAITFAVAAGLRVRPHAPPDSSPTLDRRSLPLRV